MKKEFLLVVLLGMIIPSMVVAQSFVIYNGEDVNPDWWPAGSTPEVGNHWDNPKKEGANMTDKVATIWRNGGDDPWTGGGLGGLSLNASELQRFTLLVLKETAGLVQIEVQGEGSGNHYLQAMYVESAVNEWQLLDFALPEDHGFTTITTVLVAPHMEDTRDNPSFVGHRMYWDELMVRSDISTRLIDPIVSSGVVKSDLYTISGKHYKTFPGEPRMESVSQGIYILVCTYSDGSISREKVVK